MLSYLDMNILTYLDLFWLLSWLSCSIRSKIYDFLPTRFHTFRGAEDLIFHHISKANRELDIWMVEEVAKYKVQTAPAFGCLQVKDIPNYCFIIITKIFK